MAKAIQVMIVDDSDDTRQSLSMMLEMSHRVEVVAQAQNGAEAIHKLSVITPDIILMDVNMPVLDGVQATERISMQYPNVAVIVLSVQNDVEYVRRCMRAGAKDYLFKPVSLDTLTETVQNVYAAEQERLTRNTVAVLADQSTQKSKALAFISAKGGVGKTTIATSLAAALAHMGRRVALLDCDLQFGDASLFFNAAPPRTLLDLVRESNEIDPDVLARYVFPHSTGVSLIAAPRRPEEAEYVTAGHVQVVIQALKKQYDYVIVDTAPTANDVFFSVLETADHSFMVNTMNLAVLKNNRILLDLLSELGYATGEIRQLLNRSNVRNGLKIRDVEKVLQNDVYWELDHDTPFVESSINEGIPFVLRNEQHRLSKQIYTLTARLEADLGLRASRRNPLRKVFRVRTSPV